MRFVIFAFLLVLLAGFFHIMFIMYDSVWYDADTGIIPRLADKLNNSLTGDTKNNSWNTTKMLRDAFGMGRVICIILVPACLVLEAFDKPRVQG
jgi:hypothetical protein